MNWEQYAANDYGFAMLVPAGSAITGRDLGNGWGALQVDVGGGVQIFGVAQLGPHASPEEIEAFAVNFTGLPAGAWALRDKGANSCGWFWYRLYEAQNGHNLAFAVLGTGPRGNYLVVVKTTVQDFVENRGLYMQWYNSITLY
jgi:hypothetical protein